MSTYRPAPSRRDSDSRSPDHPNDRYRSGRNSDYTGAGDRNRDSRYTSRATDIVPPPRRPAPELRPESPASRMDLDKACTDVARLCRILSDNLADKVKATIKKDTHLEGFRRRLAEYEKQKSNSILEPSVVEACERHKSHYKLEEEKIEKELVTANAAIDKSLDRLAPPVVRFLLEAVKRDPDNSSRKPVQDARNPQLEKQLDTLLKDHTTTVTKLEEAKRQIESRATNDRTQKLEDQMASLLKSFEAQQAASDKSFREQQAILDRLQQENTDLQAQNTAFKAQQDQLQAQLDAKVLQDGQLEARNQEKESLESQVAVLRTQVNNLQSADFPASLREARTEFTNSLQDATAKLNTTAHSILPQQFRALEAQVKQHDEAIRDIDPEEYREAVAKLLAYPAWMHLNSRIQEQSADIRHIGLENKGLTSMVKNQAAAVSARLTTLEEGSEARFRAFSDSIVQKCSELVQKLESSVGQLVPRIGSLEARLTSIEARPVAASRAPSAVVTASPRPTEMAMNGNSPALELVPVPTEARATDVQGLRGELEVVRKMVAKLKQEMHESYSAHEMMIMGLDEQFKSMTTVELANIILENLKKLPTNIPPVDVQNFHERLEGLELFRQEHFHKDGTKCSSAMKSLAKDITKFTETTRDGLAKRKRDEQGGELGLN